MGGLNAISDSVLDKRRGMKVNPNSREGFWVNGIDPDKIIYLPFALIVLPSIIPSITSHFESEIKELFPCEGGERSMLRRGCHGRLI